MISNNYYFTYTNYLIVNETDVELGNFHSPSKVNYDQMLRNDPVGCLTVIYNSNKLGKHMMPSIRKDKIALWLKLLKKNIFCIWFK